MFCVMLLATQGQAESIAAQVNGQPISKLQVDRGMLRSQVSRKELSDKERELIRHQILRLLIDDALIDQFLDKQNVSVTETEVQQHIDALAAQLQKEEQVTLQQFLQKMQIDEQTMRQDIRRLKRWTAWASTQIDLNTLQAYFEANRAALEGAAVKASHILIEVKPDADVNEREQAVARLRQIQAQLAGGTTFSEAAKRFSDCPSKEHDGDLGYFTRRGQMTENFAQTAFDMRVGQISDIVETEFGYHLILVTDRKPGQPVEFNNVAPSVEQWYIEDLRRSILRRLRESATVEILMR